MSRAKPDYQLTLTDKDFFRLRPKQRMMCEGILQAAVSNVSAAGSAHDVAYEVLKTFVDPSQPNGLPSILGGRPPKWVETYRKPVTVRVTTGTFETVLNEIVRQVPGLVWILHQGQRRAWEVQDGAVECSVWLYAGDAGVIANAQRMLFPTRGVG